MRGAKAWRAARWALVFGQLLLACTYPSWSQGQDARALFASGRLAESRANYLGAVELYRAAVSQNAAYLEPLVGLARCFFSLEEYTESLGYLQEAERLDRTNLDFVVLEGRVRLALGELATARGLFERVLSQETNNLEARFGLAELDVAEGKTRNASQRYLESLRIRPDSEKALLSLAVLSLQEGDKQAAQAYVELALRYHSNDARVYYTAAQLAATPSADTRALERAEQYLLTALALDGEFRMARRLLAEVYLRQGKPEAAIQELKKLLEDGREEPLLWYTLGMAYARAGDSEQAIRSLSQAVRLRPDDEIARMSVENLALERLPIGDPVRVQQAEYHIARGEDFRERNLFPRALIEYRRSLRLDPEGKAGRLQYAELYRILGYPAKYMKELEVLRDLGYKDSVILDDIERIRSESYGSVSARWSVDQFALDKGRYSMFIFREIDRGGEIHPFGSAAATTFLRDLVQRYEFIKVRESEPEAQGFEGAFRVARQERVDYFLLVRTEETERSFTAAADQYLASTGKRVASWQVFRTGNDRVADALNTLVGRLASSLPVRGKLLSRRFDEGLVDLGRLDGIAEGAKLSVARNGSARLAGAKLELEVRDEDLLGTWTATKVDENVAEGLLQRRSFFDLINPGDEILSVPPQPEQKAEPASQADQGLLRRLLRLVGL
jgi:tetratricopeptide (TPR) repeat protein